jgi:predicted Fe-Mo cluster-binding NifX family protein
MKVAIPTHRGRISPLFDSALQAVLVDLENGEEVSRIRFTLPGRQVRDQVQALVSSGAHALVCGAVSGFVLREILRSGLRVWPGVMGETDEIIACLAARGSLGSEFRMPGCGRKGGGSGNRRRAGMGRWGWHAPSEGPVRLGRGRGRGHGSERETRR